MRALTSHDIADAIGAAAVGEPAHAETLVADSRTVVPGVAFAAVAGGHGFVAAALAGGAPYVVVQDASVVPDGATAIVVDDVVVALGAIASHVRSQASYDVVGITGSTGKTLTKDFVAAALRTSLRVHATPKSFNAEIGVPLTVLSAPADTQVLVAELAARRPGEIAELCEIVRPRTGVITGIGKAHLELFGSREVIARTKSELIASLPADGLAVVPSDDDFVNLFSRSAAARIAAVGPGARVAYGADRIDRAGRTHGWVRVDGERLPVTLPVPGRPLMRNAALAVRVAMECGVPAPEAAAVLEHAPLSSWRMEILEVGTRTIVNDAYNSNPTSLAAALRAARELSAGRELWAVLGHMAELGPTSGAEHERMGALAAALGYAGIVVLGEEAAGLSVGAGGIAHRVHSLAEAAEAVRTVTGEASVVLIKASRVAGLERLVEQLGTEGAKRV
jgi:UDP-N-acetylmuramoyl-tripeptide--D-alanyl-D-alanine ligase